MTGTDLNTFIERAAAAGISRERTASELEQAGWPAPQIEAALEGYAASDLPLAVPRPAMAPAARELFVYLSLFASLYMSVTTLGSIVFQLINIALPDPTDQFGVGWGYWFGDPESKLRSGIASVAVFLPTYLLLDRHVERGLRADPTRRGSGVRRKLTYLTLFITGFVLLSDVVYQIDSWLSGELSQRVILKGLTVAALAALVLGRYLVEMFADERLDPQRAGQVRRSASWIFALASLAAVIGALFNVPSPATARARQFDRTRETALEQIDRSVGTYFRAYKKLPPSLSALATAHHVRFPRDPETGKDYGYEVKGEKDYRLCTSFSTARTEQELMMEGGAYVSAYASSTFSEHPAGPHCFDKQVGVAGMGPRLEERMTLPVDGEEVAAP